MAVRAAKSDGDIRRAAELLHAFNVEYDFPTPPVPELAGRLRVLVNGNDTAVLLNGEPAVGVAVARFRLSIWGQGEECYLAELYVEPPSRGQGFGSALLAAVLEEARRRGCDWIDLATSEDDVAARGLYERFGFTNREGPGGPLMYVYERELG